MAIIKSISILILTIFIYISNYTSIYFDNVYISIIPQLLFINVYIKIKKIESLSIDIRSCSKKISRCRTIYQWKSVFKELKKIKNENPVMDKFNKKYFNKVIERLIDIKQHLTI